MAGNQFSNAASKPDILVVLADDPRRNGNSIVYVGTNSRGRIETLPPSSIEDYTSRQGAKRVPLSAFEEDTFKSNRAAAVNGAKDIIDHYKDGLISPSNANPVTYAEYIQSLREIRGQIFEADREIRRGSGVFEFEKGFDPAAEVRKIDRVIDGLEMQGYRADLIRDMENSQLLTLNQKLGIAQKMGVEEIGVPISAPGASP